MSLDITMLYISRSLTLLTTLDVTGVTGVTAVCVTPDSYATLHSYAFLSDFGQLVFLSDPRQLSGVPKPRSGPCFFLLEGVYFLSSFFKRGIGGDFSFFFLLRPGLLRHGVVSPIRD